MDPVQPSSLETTFNNKDSTRPSDSSVSKDQEIKERIFCFDEEFEAFDPEEFARWGVNEAYSFLPGVYPPLDNLQASSPVTKPKISRKDPVKECYSQMSQKMRMDEVSTAAKSSVPRAGGLDEWIAIMASEYEKQEMRSAKEEEGVDESIDMMAEDYEQQEIHYAEDEEEGFNEWIDMMAEEYDKQKNNSVPEDKRIL